MSIFWVTPLRARRSSENRRHPGNRCQRIGTFQRPPMTTSVASAGQVNAGALRAGVRAVAVAGAGDEEPGGEAPRGGEVKFAAAAVVPLLFRRLIA